MLVAAPNLLLLDEPTIIWTCMRANAEDYLKAFKGAS